MQHQFEAAFYQFEQNVTGIEKLLLCNINVYLPSIYYIQSATSIVMCPGPGSLKVRELS